jgi:hypothetical protein
LKSYEKADPFCVFPFARGKVLPNSVSLALVFVPLRKREMKTWSRLGQMKMGHCGGWVEGEKNFVYFLK